MTQTERIKTMEQRLDLASAAVMQLSAAIDGYVAVGEAIRELSAYYGSDTWKQDLADDEAGRLPQDMKRGVLSEDGIWNLLEDNKELLARIKAMVTGVIRPIPVHFPKVMINCLTFCTICCSTTS
jgi:hypothetical protein